VHQDVGTIPLMSVRAAIFFAAHELKKGAGPLFVLTTRGPMPCAGANRKVRHTRVRDGETTRRTLSAANVGSAIARAMYFAP